MNKPRNSMHSIKGRQTELAKIHIGAKQLDIEGQEYRDMLWTLCRVHSSADLDQLGRKKIIDHLKSQGAIFISKKKPVVKKSVAAITEGEVRKIYALWAALADAGVVKDSSKDGLRKWVKVSSRRYHPRRFGYDAPELLDGHAATGVIEQLKKWCQRTNVEIE